MKVIPVVDLRRKVVVHGRLGRREEYLPVRSVLHEGCNPIEIARVFAELGFRELYVADLDAIMEGEPSLELYRRMTGNGRLSLMVDAGVDSVGAALAVLESGASKVIVGTETLTNEAVVSSLTERFAEKVVISLDMSSRRLLAKTPTFQGLDAISAALRFQDMGIQDVILLDLARVGSNAGPDLQLIREVKARCDLRLLVGGGVRDLRDLRILDTYGVDAALVATALHSGSINIDELRATGFL